MVRFDRNDSETLFGQMTQFLREELDAASRGDERSINFANSLCSDPSWYKGAMGEEAEYPIDGEDGPQQTLLQLIIPFIKEDPDLAIKIRCRIVKILYRDYKLGIAQISGMPVSPIQVGELAERMKKLEYLTKRVKSEI